MSRIGDWIYELLSGGAQSRAKSQAEAQAWKQQRQLSERMDSALKRSNCGSLVNKPNPTLVGRSSLAQRDPEMHETFLQQQSSIQSIFVDSSPPHCPPSDSASSSHCSGSSNSCSGSHSCSSSSSSCGGGGGE